LLQNNSANIHFHFQERSVIKYEPPPPLQRKEIVEVRREIIKVWNGMDGA
jgi:hypothetical protein